MAKKRSPRRTAQAPKVGNRAMNAAMLELRRSSAASPHRSGTDYRRKPKHAGKGWE